MSDATEVPEIEKSSKKVQKSPSVKFQENPDEIEGPDVEIIEQCSCEKKSTTSCCGSPCGSKCCKSSCKSKCCKSKCCKSSCCKDKPDCKKECEDYLTPKFKPPEKEESKKEDPCSSWSFLNKTKSQTAPKKTESSPIVEAERESIPCECKDSKGSCCKSKCCKSKCCKSKCCKSKCCKSSCSSCCKKDKADCRLECEEYLSAKFMPPEEEPEEEPGPCGPKKKKTPKKPEPLSTPPLKQEACTCKKSTTSCCGKSQCCKSQCCKSECCKSKCCKSKCCKSKCCKSSCKSSCCKKKEDCRKLCEDYLTPKFMPPEPPEEKAPEKNNSWWCFKKKKENGKPDAKGRKPGISKKKEKPEPKKEIVKCDDESCKDKPSGSCSSCCSKPKKEDDDSVDEKTSGISLKPKPSDTQIASKSKNADNKGGDATASTDEEEPSGGRSVTPLIRNSATLGAISVGAFLYAIYYFLMGSWGGGPDEGSVQTVSNVIRHCYND